MNSMELMNSLTDLDDDILLEAESVPVKSRRRHTIRRAVMIAAAAALLCVGVFAAVDGFSLHITDVEWNMEEHHLSEEYYGTDSENLNFHYIEVAYELEPVAIRDAAGRILKNYTTDALSARSHVADNVRYHCGDNLMDSVEGYEEFLGVELALTDQIREAAAEYIPKQEFDSITVSSVPMAQAKSEYAQIGTVSPSGIMLCFFLTEDDYDEAYNYVNVDNVTVYIYMALDEDYAKECSKDTLASYEKEGALSQEKLLCGDIEVTILYNQPEEGFDGAAHAFYVVDGIYYKVSVWDALGDGDPKAELLSYLEGLGE